MWPALGLLLDVRVRLVPLVLLMLFGCVVETWPCPEAARPGVVVRLVDASTQMPICDAVVIVGNARWTETIDHRAGTDEHCLYEAATERPGKYAATACTTKQSSVGSRRQPLPAHHRSNPQVTRSDEPVSGGGHRIPVTPVRMALRLAGDDTRRP
jgi:hypothetical protein